MNSDALQVLRQRIRAYALWLFFIGCMILMHLPLAFRHDWTGLAVLGGLFMLFYPISLMSGPRPMTACLCRYDGDLLRFYFPFATRTAHLDEVEAYYIVPPKLTMMNYSTTFINGALGIRIRGLKRDVEMDYSTAGGDLIRHLSKTAPNISQKVIPQRQMTGLQLILFLIVLTVWFWVACSYGIIHKGRPPG